MSKPDLWVAFCNPENRRHRYFKQALEKVESSQLMVIAYEDLLAATDIFEFLSSQFSNIRNSHLCIKIDSPGENFQVTRALIALGAREYSDRITPLEARDLTFEKGRFGFLKEWYFGFRKLVECIQEYESELTSRGNTVAYINSPESIIKMGNKKNCQDILDTFGVSIPPAITLINNFDTWVDQLIAMQTYQVFIKPCYGSSAAGVVALRIKPDGSAMFATTSLRMANDKCYNSLKLCKYSDRDDIKCLFNIVLQEDAYCERWISKPQVNGKNFDLRVVVINGKASHWITRCSVTPITNLHLGNERGNILQHPHGAKMLENAMNAAERTAKVFPTAGVFGADVIVNKTKARILELNAFGDLLPGVENNGLCTYDAQIKRRVCC